jgi:hypothetical protein
MPTGVAARYKSAEVHREGQPAYPSRACFTISTNTSLVSVGLTGFWHQPQRVIIRFITSTGSALSDRERALFRAGSVVWKKISRSIEI